jgi:Putative Ig domain
MLPERVGFPEVAQSSSPARILPLLLVVVCCFTLGACSSTLQNSAASSPAPGQTPQSTISIQATLPSASIGKAYSAVLSISGGRAPYNFLVTGGALPPGLALNPRTGSISGDPTQAGTSQFTILVTDIAGSVEIPGHPGTIADSGTHTFTMVVGPCVACSNVQISPANPSVAANGKIQFTATITNTNNPAVTWSANAGTISSGGLFVAPATTSTRTVQIVATSVAQPADQATTTITVTSGSASDLRVATASVPAASKGVAYTTSLTASGGSAPYQWKVASGSLPSGLQLNSATGVISGSPAQVGTYTFTVSVSDPSAYSAQQSLTLAVSISQLCGPPAYCARQDTLISQPIPVPKMGGLTGAGTCVVPTDFGYPICRLTDSNWDPYLSSNTFTPIGDDARHELNCQRTLAFLSSSDGLGYVGALSYRSTAPYMSLAHVYPANSAWSAHGGWFVNSSSGGWSWNCGSTPNRLYLDFGAGGAANSTEIQSFDFTGWTSSPSSGPANAVVYNFMAGSTGSWGTTSSDCLSSTYQPTWSELFGTTKNPADQVFAMGLSGVQGIASGIDTVSVTRGSNAFTVSGSTALRTDGSLSNAQILIAGVTYAIASVSSGGLSGTLTQNYAGASGSRLAMQVPSDQGTGMDVVAYKVGSGCVHLNTGTGAITGDFGATGTASTSDRFYIHGVRITPDGSYAVISTARCVAGYSCNTTLGYIWTIGTTTVVPMCASPNDCGGHAVDGFTHIANNGASFPQLDTRLYGDSVMPMRVIPSTAWPLTNCGVSSLIDTHLSWQDVDALDTYPLLVSTTAFGASAQTPGSYNCPLIDEVFAVDPTNGTIYRFAHTLITGLSWNYGLQNGLGQMSDDGQYFMFGSDWNGTLGRFDLGSGSCVNSPAGNSACRGDVFMVNLAATPVF